MDTLVYEVTEKIKILKLNYLDDENTSKIVKIAFNSVLNFINLNFNPFFDFNSIKHLITDIAIGEYLLLVKNANLAQQIQPDEAIKTISEGDITITYFESETKDKKVDLLIKHFLGKKRELLAFKTINW